MTATAADKFGFANANFVAKSHPIRLQSRRLQKRDHFGIELCIVIQNDVTIRLFSGECLPKLLDHPIGSWVRGDVAVQDLATLMCASLPIRSAGISRVILYGNRMCLPLGGMDRGTPEIVAVMWPEESPVSHEIIVGVVICAA